MGERIPLQFTQRPEQHLYQCPAKRNHLPVRRGPSDDVTPKDQTPRNSDKWAVGAPATAARRGTGGLHLAPLRA